MFYITIRMIYCAHFGIYSFKCLLLQFLVSGALYFDTCNDGVQLARRIAPEQPRRAGFGGPEHRVGCNDVSSPRWLMIRRLWAMLLPSSMMPITCYLYAAFTAEKSVLFFTNQVQ